MSYFWALTVFGALATRAIDGQIAWAWAYVGFAAACIGAEIADELRSIRKNQAPTGASG